MNKSTSKSGSGSGNGNGVGKNKKSTQTTLFQTWGYEGNKTTTSAATSSTALEQARLLLPPSSSATSFLSPRINASNADATAEKESDTMIGDDAEDEDAFLREAMEISLAQYNADKERRRSSMHFVPAANSSLSLAPPQSTSVTSASTNATGAAAVAIGSDDDDYHGFDLNSGRSWIYPTNYPEREYQFKIVESSLYENTLVTLPTGLGKTFIAAVVMYNYFRWFPLGKIVFMAPTKPLVAQQIEACFNIMGVPQIETMVMTGDVAVKIRSEAYKQKRIFFVTPQVVSNDLSRGLFPARDLRLLVVDEAHRAQGDYAYCHVIRELMASGGYFRVMALSATPGTDMQAVRQMLQNLMISHIELRSEDSPDIVPYTFERTVEKVVVGLGAELKALKEKYLAVLEHFIKRLAQSGVAASKKGNAANPSNYTKFGLLKMREEFRRNPPMNLAKQQKGAVEGDFAASITLYHAYELLLQHGMRAFYNFMMKSIGEGEGVNRRLRFELQRMPMWRQIEGELREKLSTDLNNSRLNSSGPKLPSQFSQPEEGAETGIVLGHPKLERLREMVLEHFRTKESEGVATRVMIFSQYRDSVQEITACLHAHRPLVKVMQFVGQAGTKGKKGLKQKEQIEVIRRFRTGGYNTLVATCVGEEGLDIGEVDLIVCYDVSKSPIRLVQRMGRTGRKRAGRIIVLVTEGKEEQTYNQSMYTKNAINKAIMEKGKLTSYLTKAPRMIPPHLTPTCYKMCMQVGKFVNSKSTTKTVVGPENNRRISGMFREQGTSFRQSSGFLSNSELDYWRANFYVEEETIPSVKKRTERWNKRKKKEDDNDEQAIGREYNLSEWMLWQDEKPKRLIATQSATCKMLTDTLAAFRPGGLNPADTHKEMLELWLDERDVIISDERDIRPKRTLSDHFKRPPPLPQTESSKDDAVDRDQEVIDVIDLANDIEEEKPLRAIEDDINSTNDWPPILNSAFDDSEVFTIRTPPKEVPSITEADLLSFDFGPAFRRIWGGKKEKEISTPPGSWGDSGDDSLFDFDLSAAVETAKVKGEEEEETPASPVFRSQPSPPASPVFPPSQIQPKLLKQEGESKTSTPNMAAAPDISRLKLTPVVMRRRILEEVDIDCGAVFEDSSFDLVECSHVTTSSKKMSRLDSMKKKRRHTMESDVVNLAIEDIQANDSLLLDDDDNVEQEEEDKEVKVEDRSSLLGPTQLANLLDSKTQSVVGETRGEPSKVCSAAGEEGTEDMFGDDYDDDVFLGVSDARMSLKISPIRPHTKHTAVSPLILSSPVVLSSMCGPSQSVLLSPRRSSQATTAPFQDQSSLCLIDRKRKAQAMSSDEEREDTTTSEKEQSTELIVFKKKRKKTKKSDFIDDEAQLSGGEGEASSDEAEQADDAFEASFVDDATQKVDCRAMYLKSLKSPAISRAMRRPTRPGTEFPKF